MYNKHIRRMLIPVCMLAALAACKPAENSAVPDASTAVAAVSQIPAVPAAPDLHFLWRVSRGHETLYLVGSIHALNPDDYPLPAVMEDAFKHSSRLVEEINLTMVDTASMQQMALRMGAYPKGKSLRTDLPPNVYKRVSAGAQKLGIEMQRLNRLRPWLGSIAVLDMQLKQAGYRASDGVDHHFANEAQMSGKRVIGLETAYSQLRLLARLSAKVQQDMLLQSLDQAENFSREMQNLIDAWRKGDTGALEKILNHEFDGYPLAYRLLIVDRNRAWMPQLKRMMRGGRPIFVVVGALHMVGKDGLLAQFKKAGYKVEQL